MGRATTLTYSFNIGEKSKAGLARVDQEALKLAAEVQENLLPRVVGAAQVRPGTQYIGGIKSNNPCRFLKFIKRVNDTALVELTDSVMRVWVSDALVTRPSVTSTVTNGDFSSSTGWTLTTTGGASADINSTVAGSLVLRNLYRGSSATCLRSVTTSTPNVRHALRIVVTNGPVNFRCGSSSGADDYINETALDTGTHSLAFTPTGTYWVYFEASTDRYAIIDSIQVESAGVMELPGPWSAAQLPVIRYDQSGDILFLAHNSWQQRKIERRATDSWSIVLYKADGGPFSLTRTANVSLKPGGHFNNTTLTADGNFFRPQHVGALFRLTHDRLNETWGLGGNNVFTDAIRVSGVGSDNDWTNNRSGTWSGTLTVQRSYTDRISGFIDTGTTYTTSAGSAVSPGSSYDNVIHYYRIGFKDGDYTSGSVLVTITYSGDAGSGICRVTAYNSPTSVNVEVLSPFKNTIYTDNWQEGDWSDNVGWPSAVGFFDGRLWWARDDKFWGSISDQYYAYTLDEDLNTDAAGDAGSIQRNIATGGSINTVAWIMSLQRLLFGTTGAETSARASSLDQPLTPTACTLKDASTQGSANVSPVKIDGRGFYVQRSGTRVYELSFSYEDNDYVSTNMMRLNEDIGGTGINALDVQRQPETYVWMVRADGQAPLLIYEPKEKVAGFSRIISDGASGLIEQVVILPGTGGEDLVYLVVNRTINSGTVRYLEKLALRSEAQGSSAGNKIADSHVFSAGPVSSVTAAHLANQTGLIGWGYSGSTPVALTGLSADGSGVVALGQTLTNVCVGLPYRWRYKSAKLAFGTQGTPVGQPKIVKQIGLLLADFSPAAINYGDSFSSTYGGTGTMYQMPTVENGQSVDTTAVQSVYDSQAFPFGTSNWSTDSRICLAGSAPYPATLLGLVIDMQTNE